MNVLLIYLQPKCIKEVLEPLSKIPVDKLYLKYYPYPDVYKLAYNFIRDHPEYTHIFWLQNDIVLTSEHFNQILYKYGTNPDIQVLGVAMNVDLQENKHKLAFSTAPISPKNLNIDWPINGFFDGIIEVFHNGGPFLINREIFMVFPLRGDKRGYNADIYHGIELWEAGIPYYLDTDITLKHLRYYGEMLVNKKEPEMEFVRWT